MTNQNVGAAGFWSYTHRDNEADNGRIIRIATRLQAEFELLTGQEIEIFVDRSGIAWGDQWRQRINDALQVTTFFIALVTPRYLQSEECRREILQFASEAKSLGLQKLLLPVLYASVAELDNAKESGDEVLGLIAQTQWEDWTSLRLLDEQSTEYRVAVNRLAKRLADISKEIQDDPPNLPDVLNPDDDSSDSSAPGVYDLMAVAEAALPEWARSIADFGEHLNELNQKTTPMGEELERSDRQGKGFAGRLSLIRSYAIEVDPLADKMISAGSRYSSHLMSVDPAIIAMLREISGDPDVASTEEAVSLLKEIRRLATEAKTATNHMRGLSTVLDEAGRSSRDLRKVTTKIGTSVKSLIDGQAIIDEWVRRMDEIEGSR